jgi:hypothetical protein
VDLAEAPWTLQQALHAISYGQPEGDAILVVSISEMSNSFREETSNVSALFLKCAARNSPQLPFGRNKNFLYRVIVNTHSGTNLKASSEKPETPKARPRSQSTAS